MDAVDALRRTKDKIAALEADEEAAKAVIMTAMGEHDTLIDAAGKPLATWRLASPAKRLDGKALAAAHPNIHAAFLREGDASRRFLLKGEK